VVTTNSAGDILTATLDVVATTASTCSPNSTAAVSEVLTLTSTGSVCEPSSYTMVESTIIGTVVVPFTRVVLVDAAPSCAALTASPAPAPASTSTHTDVATSTSTVFCSKCQYTTYNSAITTVTKGTAVTTTICVVQSPISTSGSTEGTVVSSSGQVGTTTSSEYTEVITFTSGSEVIITSSAGAEARTSSTGPEGTSTFLTSGTAPTSTAGSETKATFSGPEVTPTPAQGAGSESTSQPSYQGDFTETTFVGQPSAAPGSSISLYEAGANKVSAGLVPLAVMLVAFLT
jgi:hypothetical protein